MRKIRINELARELEVNHAAVIDTLPELGITEKKTHSSSIDEDMAGLAITAATFRRRRRAPSRNEPAQRDRRAG